MSFVVTNTDFKLTVGGSMQYTETDLKVLAELAPEMHIRLNEVTTELMLTGNPLQESWQPVVERAKELLLRISRLTTNGGTRDRK